MASDDGPEPVESGWLDTIGNLVPLVVAGGALFVLSGAFMPRTSGATRSAKLRWQERQREIERVVPPPKPERLSH